MSPVANFVYLGRLIGFTLYIFNFRGNFFGFSCRWLGRSSAIKLSPHEALPYSFSGYVSSARFLRSYDFLGFLRVLFPLQSIALPVWGPSIL